LVKKGGLSGGGIANEEYFLAALQEGDDTI
jgi:hypothetical protein